MYNGFHINAAGEFSHPSDEEIQSKVKPFLYLGLTVGIALSIDQTAVQNGVGSKGVADAAAAASRNNVTSLMVDYEPKTNISKAHAQSYADFIKMLTDGLHHVGVESAMCVSSWSILTEFGLYAKTDVDNMMSMASTYFGRDVGSNKQWVGQEIKQGVSLSQLHVGIGSTNSIFEGWNYQWTQQKFEDFMSWLETQKVQNVDLWRTDIDVINATNGTAPWVYSGLEKFLAA